jgi:hypothetical protein
MHPKAQLDPALRDYTTTDRQREIFDAVVSYGGMRGRPGRLLGYRYR